MGKGKKIAAGVAVVTVVSISAASMMGMMPSGGAPGGPGGAMEGTANQKTVVETTSPVLGNITVSGSYVGTVEPGQQVSVYPKASGEVVTANFSVGDTVQAGDVLFALDSTSLQLDIAEQQARLTSSQAMAQLQLEQAQTNYNNYNNNVDEGLNQTLVNAENAVKNADVSVQSANADLRSARKSSNDAQEEGAEDSELNSLRDARVQRELALEQAQLKLEQAEADLALAKRQVEESAQSSEYSVKSAELGTDFSSDYISLQKLQNTLSDYTVTAPISGVVEQKNLDEYDIASTQTAAYVISNKKSITVAFSVAESALAYIRPSDLVLLEKEEQTHPGTVTEISTMVDAASGLYTVKASVENPSFELRSGSTVKLWVDTQKVEGEMMIPIDAVYYDNGTPYVYVFKGNAASRVDITVGIADEENMHVKSGLSLSDEVITTWSASLYDGAEVYLPGTVPTVDEVDEGEFISVPTDSAPEEQDDDTVAAHTVEENDSVLSDINEGGDDAGLQGSEEGAA